MRGEAFNPATQKWEPYFTVKVLDRERHGYVSAVVCAKTLTVKIVFDFSCNDPDEIRIPRVVPKGDHISSVELINYALD